MPDSLGKRLSKARLERGLTIDEAAHMTKLRPDKILALENDDYGRFPNNAYAKGFLLIYGRFLSVDVSEQTRILDTPSELQVQNYEYLQNAPPPKTEYAIRQREKSRKPSVMPIIVSAAIIAIALFVTYLWDSARRIGNLDQVGRKPATPQPTPAAATPAPAETTPTVAEAPPTAPTAEPAPSLPSDTTAIMPTPPTATPPVDTPSIAPAPASIDGLEVRRAEPVIRAPATPTPEVVRAPGGINELVISSSKKTWVKICRDDPNSPPIFMDYLYPNAGPLKLRGARFYIDARDPDAIQLRKNGAPIAYEGPSASIQ